MKGLAGLRSLGGPFPRQPGPLDRGAAVLRRPLDRRNTSRQGKLRELGELRRAARRPSRRRRWARASSCCRCARGPTTSPGRP